MALVILRIEILQKGEINSSCHILVNKHLHLVAVHPHPFEAHFLLCDILDTHISCLNLTDAPDLSPRPLFSQHNARGHASSMWNLRQGPWDRETLTREHAQVI